MEQTIFCIQCYLEKEDKWSDTWFDDIEDYDEAFKILQYCKSNAPHRKYCLIKRVIKTTLLSV